MEGKKPPPRARTEGQKDKRFVKIGPPTKRMGNDESAVELITAATVIPLPPNPNELPSLKSTLSYVAITKAQQTH